MASSRRRALAQGDHGMAARQLTQIRWIVATNLVLGVITVAIGASGRYWAERRRRVRCRSWPGAVRRDGKLEGAAQTFSRRCRPFGCCRSAPDLSAVAVSVRAPAPLEVERR
jgi:hypothetical protein